MVTIGFGTGVASTTAQADDAPLPAVRKGRLGASGDATNLVPGKTLTRVDAVVRDGDSGGPVVDADGQVRGVVLFIDPKGGGGLLMRSAEVLTLPEELRRARRSRVGGRPLPSRPRSALGAGLPGRARQLHRRGEGLPRAHARGLDGRPGDGPRERRVPGGRGRRPQAFLLALGIVSAIAALACALALAGPAIARAFTPER